MREKGTTVLISDARTRAPIHQTQWCHRFMVHCWILWCELRSKWRSLHIWISDLRQRPTIQTQDQEVKDSDHFYLWDRVVGSILYDTVTDSRDKFSHRNWYTVPYTQCLLWQQSSDHSGELTKRTWCDKRHGLKATETTPTLQGW